MTPFQALACPLDGKALQQTGSAWRCANGHSFDIARQGYVHLLPVQNKRSRDPGDSKEMVAARQRFLNAGHYQPIAEAVSVAVLAELPAEDIASCLDAGCGEGYYLRELAKAASNEQRSLALLGLDISKWAILSAAKQDNRAAAKQDSRVAMKQKKHASWVVGSNARLPVQPGTLDRLLCLFGFPVYGEFAQALKPGGWLLQVDAGPDHLRELREIIYPTLKPERPNETSTPEGFSLLDTQTIGYSLELAGADPIADLLAMTPHLYRASAEGRARAAALESLTVTVDVRLKRFVRELSV